MAAFISHILPGFHKNIVEKEVTGRQNQTEWNLHSVCALGESSSRKATVGVNNLKRYGAALGLVALFTFTGLSGPNDSFAEIVTSPQCFQGEGPGCDTNTSDNGYVAKLLQKSRENRDKNNQETLEKYWKQGYGDYFSFGYSKELVKGPDGKWFLRDPDNPLIAAQKRLKDLVPDKSSGDESSDAKSTGE